MPATPPPMPAPSVDPAVAPAATTPKKASPRKKTASPKKKNSSATPDSPGSPGSPGSSSNQKFTPALKQAALALKLRGIAVKKIAEQLDVNYKTVWNYIDRTTKARAKIGTDGALAEQLSEAEKKEAATALKLSGWAVKDIAATLDMNYKTVWNYLDRQQKAAGLPAVTQDPEL